MTIIEKILDTTIHTVVGALALAGLTLLIYSVLYGLGAL